MSFSLFTANLRELTLVYQKIQIQKLSPIYPKETESKTLSPSWDDDNRCPQLSFFLEMLCCRRTIVLDPQHGRDSACPQFLLLSMFIFYIISKCPLVEESTAFLTYTSQNSIFSQITFLRMKTQPISFYIPSFA